MSSALRHLVTGMLLPVGSSRVHRWVDAEGLLALAHATLSAPELDAALRALATPVIARIVDDRVALDLRTVMPEQDARLVELLSGV